MKNMKFRIESVKHFSDIEKQLIRLGYDKFEFNKSKHHKFLFADKNGELTIETAKNEKYFDSLSGYTETTLEELKAM